MIRCPSIRWALAGGEVLLTYESTHFWAKVRLLSDLSPHGWRWPSMTRLPVEEQTPKRSCI